MYRSNKTQNGPDKPETSPGWLSSNWLVVGLAVAFIVAIGITGYLTFLTVRGVVASWTFTDLPGISISRNPTPSPGPLTDFSLPLQPATGPTPQPWDGASRVTLLVMGLDYRDWEENQGAPRTDTMILFTIDPLSRTAGMLSIPRDLWVNIPGFEPNKINTAYRFGEVYKLPGGGPGLAMGTVEGLIGVPISFYALIDFYAFEQFIDEIGGITVQVPEEIKVDPLGPGNTVVLEPGTQTLDGEVALAYARARNSEGGDFDRAQRQQQVVLAIRDQILQLELLPVLISKAPVLYQEIASGIVTNLTLDQALKLAVLAQQIEVQNIRRGVIGPPEHVTFGISPEGLDILRPVPDKIRLLRDDIFTSDILSSPAAVAEDPIELVIAENANISILNGTFTAGLAAQTTDYLEKLGIDIAVTDNAAEAFNQTTIIDYTGNPYTVQFLVDLMEISPNRIFSRFDPASQVDVEVSLGDDWATNNPMP